MRHAAQNDAGRQNGISAASLVSVEASFPGAWRGGFRSCRWPVYPSGRRTTLMQNENSFIWVRVFVVSLMEGDRAAFYSAMD
jgi:hypothetical protein